MSISSAQRRYALNRVSDAMQSHKARLRAQYTTPAQQLSPEQRYQALSVGRWTMRPGARPVIHKYTHLMDIILFDDDHEMKFDEAAYEKALAPVVERYESLKDQIMLGDAQDVLALIESFANDPSGSQQENNSTDTQ